MNAKTKAALVLAVLIVLAAMASTVARNIHPQPSLTYSQFLNAVQAGQIASVIVNTAANSGANQAICRTKDGKIMQTILPADYHDALLAMQDRAVSIEIREDAGPPSRLLLNSAPFLVLLLVWIVLMTNRSWLHPALR